MFKIIESIFSYFFAGEYDDPIKTILPERNTKTTGKKSITALQVNQFKIIGEFK